MKKDDVVILDLLPGAIIGKVVAVLADGSFKINRPAKILFDEEKIYMYRYTVYSDEVEFIFNYHSIMCSYLASEDIAKTYLDNIERVNTKTKTQLPETFTKKDKKMYN